jgi:hypothetical protein
MPKRHRVGAGPRHRLHFWERAALPAAMDVVRKTWNTHVIGRSPTYLAFKERLLSHHLFTGARDRFVRAAYSRFVRSEP